MKNKIAFILNYASHYRLFIYKKIEQELDADFYFGNIPNSSIKKIDYKELANFIKEFKTLKFFNFYWYSTSVILIFKPYKNYVLTGDPQILSNWLILIIGKLLGKKVYLWTHGWYGKEKGIKKIIKKTYFKLAYKLFLYGDYSKKLLLVEGFKNEKLVVIYNSLDYDKQIDIKKNLVKSNIYQAYFQNDFPTLFYIGRIQKSKKIEQILEAMKILIAEGFYTNLAIIGNIDSNYKFKEIIKDYGLQKYVWLIGAKYNEDEIVDYIFNADVCVSPGNIGLTALHSLVYDTPVITHNNFKNQMPEFETICDGINGHFYKEDDIEDLSSKIKLGLKSRLDNKNISFTIDEKWNPNNQIKIFKKELE